jgi:hypothetical protein
MLALIRLYKLFVLRLLLVLITNSKTEIDYLDNLTKDFPCQKYFIINDPNYNRQHKKNLNVITLPNFDLNLNGIEILTRLIFLYSNPEFEYFITFQHNKYIDQEYIKTIIDELESNKSFILNNKIFATCREFTAYNGFNFNNVDTEEDQSIEDVHNLNLAMTGLPVNNKIFLLALKDVLPASEIVIDNSIEPEISKFLFQINLSSEEKIYAITDLDKFDKSILTKKDMILLFTKQKNNFTNLVMAVYRNDGMNAYILK